MTTWSPVAGKFCVTATELAAANDWTDFDQLPAPGDDILIPPVGDRTICPDPAS